MSQDLPTDARARLDLAARSPLDRPRDRRRHAVVTAVYGPVFALYLVLGRGVDAPVWVSVAFFTAAGLLAWWQTPTRTVPRHVSALSRGALVATLVVFSVALMVLNGVAGGRDGDVPGWLTALALVVVAAPALVCGALIARSPHR